MLCSMCQAAINAMAVGGEKIDGCLNCEVERLQNQLNIAVTALGLIGAFPQEEWNTNFDCPGVANQALEDIAQMNKDS